MCVKSTIRSLFVCCCCCCRRRQYYYHAAAADGDDDVGRVPYDERTRDRSVSRVYAGQMGYTSTVTTPHTQWMAARCDGVDVSNGRQRTAAITWRVCHMRIQNTHANTTVGRTCIYTEEKRNEYGTICYYCFGTAKRWCATALWHGHAKVLCGMMRRATYRHIQRGLAVRVGVCIIRLKWIEIVILMAALDMCIE